MGGVPTSIWKENSTSDGKCVGGGDRVELYCVVGSDRHYQAYTWVDRKPEASGSFDIDDFHGMSGHT